MKRIFTLLFLLVLLVTEQANAQTEQPRPVVRSVNNVALQKLAQHNNTVSAASDFTATPAASATALAQALAGTGVVVSNANLRCDNNGSGTFSYSGATLGISSGIVLTTGYVSDIGQSAQIVSQDLGTTYTDANLTNLVPNATHDVCILTFQFVPVCSTISITYEFGSSEYYGYQCSSFNDAFGLFLAGPNPAGGNYAAHTNIATLPSGQAVSINTIHDGVHDELSDIGGCGGAAANPAYYIPNYTGTDIVYEGLTTAITSTAAVTPCQTYTMEIAIGDAGDGIYDSGVFLKHNALSCPPDLATTTTPDNCSNSTGSASVTVSSYTGTPTYTWSPGGQSTSSISNQVAGTYSCTVGLTQCAITYTQAVTAVISPTTTPVTVSVNSATICSGNTTTLSASGATNYTWSPAIGLSGTTGSVVTANPASSQTYTVKGAVGTCTNTATSVVTVNTATISVTSSTICGGQQTGTLGVSGASTYTWTGGGITGSHATNPTDNPVSLTVYTVNATDVNTCTATATATITVNTPPTLTVTSASICNGAGPASLGVTGASTYTWTGGGITGSHATAPSDNPGSTTIYTVNGTDAHTCTATATGTINVIGTPTISVTGGAICKGQTTFTLTANSNATSFVWSPATGLSATTGSAVVANPTTTQSYTIVGTAGTCTVSTTATVTVNTPATLTTTSSTICVGQQTGTVTVGGANTYTWTGGGISGNTTTNPTDNPASLTVYTVNATDVNTCTATATATITVNNLPTVTVNSSTICLGQQTATLTANGASTYSWTPGLSATSGTSVTGSPATTTPYTVTGTDVKGCTNTAVATINVISNPTITVANGAMCVGQQTVALTALSNAASFVWSPAMGLSATTGSVVTANPVGTTTYTVTGTAGSCTVSTTAVVTVYALPVPTASTNVPCETESPLNLTASPTGTYTYSWSGPNSFTSSVQNPSITTFSNVTQAVAGTYTVLVTDNNSCHNTATVTVVVNTKPVITATGATVCVGQTINLTSNGAGAGPNVSYSWNGQGAYISGSQNPSILNATTAMTGIYNVVGTNTNGCYSGTAVQVQVNSLPVISILNSGPMCVGQQTTTLTASSTNAGTTYSWTPATALSATTGSAVVANPSPAAPVGTYTYLVTGTDANTCVGTFSTSIIVNPLPVPTASTNIPCETESPLNLTCTPAGTYTYSWSGPNSFTSSVQNPSITNLSAVTQAVAGTYSVLVTDINSCYNSATVTVVVNIKPTITATSGTICTGQTTTLTASGGVSYVWPSTSDINLINANGSIVAANPTVSTTSQNYTYTITGTDANGCTNTALSQVLVYPLPIVTVNSATICTGQQTATLTAAGASTYTWAPSGSLSSSTGTFVYGFPITAGENDYTVTATDIHTCINTATTSIWVNTLPTVTINTVSPECVPFCTTLTATPVPATGHHTYNWNLGNGQTSSSSDSTAVACYTVASIYVVNLLVIDGNGCTTTVSTPVNALSVPIADFDYGQQPVSILAPEVQFVNESTYGLPFHSWDFGDAYTSSSHDTSSANNPSHTYAEVGTYNVTLTVSTINGCSATVVKPVVINEDYALYVPNAFSPNGDGKNEFFKAEGEGVKTFNLYVFDRWGLLLFYSDDINKGWDGRYQGSPDLVQEDTYVWKIEATDFKSKTKSLHGTVTLLK